MKIGGSDVVLFVGFLWFFYSMGMVIITQESGDQSRTGVLLAGHRRHWKGGLRSTTSCFDGTMMFCHWEMT